MNQHTAVLLIGFGGPRGPEEVRPFLESVLEGVKIPESRLNEVLSHYEVMGGRSPYNEATESQKAALEKELKDRGAMLPVFVGYRHSTPSLSDAFTLIKKGGFQKVVGFVLSPLRSYASFGKYKERTEEGRKKAGASGIPVVYTAAFDRDPLFIEAVFQRLKEVLNGIPQKEMGRAFVLFSAHSIPMAMDAESGYASQFEAIARHAAEKLSLANWGVAYQSRSGDPRDTWLSPDVNEAIRAVDPKKFTRIVLVPAGFLCDHVEVLYDLDIEAKKTAEKKGLLYSRSGTVTAHPAFIRMMANRILPDSKPSGDDRSP